jgi:hypothetical protein
MRSAGDPDLLIGKHSKQRPAKKLGIATVSHQVRYYPQVFFFN